MKTSDIFSLLFISFCVLSSAAAAAERRYAASPPPSNASSPPPFPLLSLPPSFSSAILAAISLSSFLLLFGTHLRRRRCFLLDFCCTSGEGNVHASQENFKLFLQTWKSFKEANIQFQFKVFRRSGVGEEAYAPPRLIERGEDSSLEDARKETENLIVTAARRLLRRTSVNPRDIDILIVNSSLFSPTPSLASILINSLSLRSDVQSFNLSGMGCSAAIVSLSLAERLLFRRRTRGLALVVSTENITQNMYYGNDRSFMVSNCLFRCGCAAVLLSNRNGGGAAKMELRRWVRTNTGGGDGEAYDCVQHMEDEEGKVGVCLKPRLVEVAGRALRANILELAPSMLPWAEIAKVALDAVKRRRRRAAPPLPPPYEPDFKKAVDHFCIHPGGRAVLEAIRKGLRLSEYDMEPGKMALHRFGNTSSSGIWYALAYCEAKRRLRRGDAVWQIALGSGFKCNSALWKVLRDIDPFVGGGGVDANGGFSGGLAAPASSSSCNPWLPFINDYPAAYVEPTCAADSAAHSRQSSPPICANPEDASPPQPNVA